MNLSLDTFGHDDEIGRLFEEYDRLVRWEEHNSRLDATDPVVERAIARGRIVAFIANTATLQQDAHTSIAESEPQDVEEALLEARTAFAEKYWREHLALSPLFISGADAHEITYSFGVLVGQDWERTRWAEREKELVEALTVAGEFAANAEGLNVFWSSAADDVLRRARAVLNQERPA